MYRIQRIQHPESEDFQHEISGIFTVGFSRVWIALHRDFGFALVLCHRGPQPLDQGLKFFNISCSICLFLRSDDLYQVVIAFLFTVGHPSFATLNSK